METIYWIVCYGPLFRMLWTDILLAIQITIIEQKKFNYSNSDLKYELVVYYSDPSDWLARY